MVHSRMLKELKHFLLHIGKEVSKKEIRLNSNGHLYPQPRTNIKNPPPLASFKNIPRIIIVGAGLSGLTSAYHLQKAGIAAQIYEASDRTGGRCLTERNRFDENQYIERGGEFIDSNHTAIIELISELNLSLVDLLENESMNTKPLFLIDRTEYTQEEAYHDFLKVSENLKRNVTPFTAIYSQHTKHSKLIDSMSIIDWISLNVPGGLDSKFGQLLNVAYTIENGAECSEQSAINLAPLLSNLDEKRFNIHGASDQRYRVLGGNDQIVTNLTESLRNQINTNHRLTAIKKNANHTYTLTFDTDSFVKDIIADIVIITIPFSILRNVDYSKAGFKPLKNVAIQELGMGNNTKLHYQFKKRFWESYNCNGTIYSNQRNIQCTYESSRAQHGECGILFQLLGGKAVDLFANEDTMTNQTQSILYDLENTFSKSSYSFNGKLTIDNWGSNQWSKGSYSYRKVGQHTKFMGVEKEKEGQCYFAGEHTSLHYASYMNGAVESGIRAANEIIEEILE
jgi:monoamine oxidase